MNNILNIILLIFISLIPVVIWAFSFSYINWEQLNRKRFFIGIFWGAIAVVPILYMDKIIEYIKIAYLNIFFYIKWVDNIISFLKFSFSLEFFLFFIALISILIPFIFIKVKISFGSYLKNIFVFFLFIFFIGIFAYILNLLSLKLDFLNLWIKQDIEFNSIIFNSFKLIVLYYLLVAFIEEASKHFNFLSSSLFEINSISTWVLYAIFIALWFAMIENILYFYNYISINWFNYWFIKLYFYRSIFAIITHVFASSILAYFFTKAYLLYKNRIFSLEYIKIFFIWIFFSIFVHLIFDISLTIWFNFIIIIYLLVWYFYVTSIFYKE